MVDYVKLAGIAERLVNKSGRAVTLVRNPTTMADPMKPWKGPDFVDGEEITLDVKAVFVTPNQVRIFGLSALGDSTQFVDMVAVSEQIMILFPGENDIKQFQTVRDGTVNWNITAIQILKPADTTLLAFMGTRR
jgi:hypothetical protein